MSKRIQLFLLALLPIFALGQYPGNANDWLDFSKTYYKVQVENDGIYRVPTSILTASGMPAGSIVGTDLQMFRNGEEVAIYVSSNGQFGGSDFIEFFGEKNDGEMDTPLYENPDWQPNTHRSLFSDKSTYFITVNPGGNNLRISDIANDLTNLPTKEDYYWETVIDNSLTRLSKGKFYAIGGSALYDSNFEEAEGYGSTKLIVNTTRHFPFATDNVHTATGLSATVNVRPMKRRGTTTSNSLSATLGTSPDVSLTFTTSPALFEIASFVENFDVSHLSEGTTTFSVEEQRARQSLLFGRSFSNLS